MCLLGRLRRSSWFSNPPSGRFLCISLERGVVQREPKEKHCPSCQAPLNIRNTRHRTIVTSNGAQKVTEITTHCPEHPETVFRALTRLTPPKSKYAFDTLTEIGILRFMEHRQIGEIQNHFRERGIHIHERTIQNLCQCFLVYVVATNLESYPQIAKIGRASWRERV